jgi:hypothetical protein
MVIQKGWLIAMPLRVTRPCKSFTTPVRGGKLQFKVRKTFVNDACLTLLLEGVRRATRTYAEHNACPLPPRACDGKRELLYYSAMQHRSPAARVHRPPSIARGDRMRPCAFFSVLVSTLPGSCCINRVNSSYDLGTEWPFATRLRRYTFRPAQQQQQQHVLPSSCRHPCSRIRHSRCASWKLARKRLMTATSCRRHPQRHAQAARVAAAPARARRRRTTPTAAATRSFSLRPRRSGFATSSGCRGGGAPVNLTPRHAQQIQTYPHAPAAHAQAPTPTQWAHHTHMHRKKRRHSAQTHHAQICTLTQTQIKT